MTFVLRGLDLLDFDYSPPHIMVVRPPPVSAQQTLCSRVVIPTYLMIRSLPHDTFVYLGSCTRLSQ